MHGLQVASSWEDYAIGLIETKSNLLIMTLLLQLLSPLLIPSNLCKEILLLFALMICSYPHASACRAVIGQMSPVIVSQLPSWITLLVIKQQKAGISQV